MHSFYISKEKVELAKLYFIKCFENELESKKIKHLRL